MPFGPYSDWEDCIAQQQGKGDAEAICGAIKARLEKSGTIELTREEVRKLCPSCADRMEKLNITVLKLPANEPPTFEIAKLDEDQRLVFGWASVAIKAGDTLVTDSQGDQIEPAELEKAAYSFVEHHRVANEMHAGPPVGAIVESFVVTPDKLKKMGLSPNGAPAVAHWVGFRVSPETFAKVKAQRLRMFSIEGSATRVAA